MRLCQHPDFAQAILRAAEHFRERGLRPSIVEKDYYVTEALRMVANAARAHVVFKGGTSLSKGWNLIHRFSEDLDLFLDPQTFSPPLGTKAIDRQLKALRNAVAEHPALTHVPAESRTIGGSGRSDQFSYSQAFGGPGEVANRVLLEVGTASGRQPTATMPLTSYLAQFLAEAGHRLGADDEQPFHLELLHFRRTFVEKLFAIHGKVELLKKDGRKLGSYARHYYDLYQLAAQPEVLAMLRAAEYREIQADYDTISRAHFARDYASPEGLDFGKSDALFASGALAVELEEEYTRQCRILCYGPYPAWAEVQGRFRELRSLL